MAAPWRGITLVSCQDTETANATVCVLQFTLRIWCLPQAPDSVQNQPGRQRTLAEPVSSALKSNTRCWETGSTANGHKNMPR